MSPKKHIIFTALDLEQNQSDGFEIYSNDIIEIGYTIGNIETGEVLLQKSNLVKCPKRINPRIVTLTHISDDMLIASGMTLEEAYHDIYINHQKFESFINPVVWGCGDVRELAKQLGDKYDSRIFGRREIDVKTLYVALRIAHEQFPAGGLAKAMRKVGLTFFGIKHRADSDSFNTFKMFYHILQSFKTCDIFKV